MSDEPVAFDDDNPERTVADFRRARPASDLVPEILAAFANVPRKGDVPVPIGDDIVRHFKAKSPGWEKRIDALLREAMKNEGAAA